MKRTLIMLLGILIIQGSAQAEGNRSNRAHQHPVIFDTDADFDDTVALAALAEQHIKGLIDLRAVTITNNGGGLPGKGFQHVRCLLNSLGLEEVAVADTTYALPHAFPARLRFGIDFILDASIPDCAAGHIPSSRSASQLLADEIEAADGRLTLIATGPLTNVALAIDLLNQAHPLRAALLIDRAFIESGAVNVPGGLEGVPGFDNTQTLNTWGDPAAAETVFRSCGLVRCISCLTKLRTSFPFVYLIWLYSTRTHARLPVATSRP